MSYIKLPDKITNTFDRMTRNFIWGSTDEKRKMHLVNWVTVTSCKEQDGLGLKKCDTKNRSMLVGLAWMLLEHSRKLWAKTLLNKYKNSPIRGPVGRVVSRTWKNIPLGWRDTLGAAKWVVFKGSGINFFRSNWLTSCKPIKSHVEGPFLQHEMNFKLINLYKNEQWCFEGLSITIPDSIKEIIRDQRMNFNVNKEDHQVWGLTKNEKFTLSTAYNFLASRVASRNTTNKDFGYIWRANVSNRIRMFMWTLHHDRFPTNYHLNSRG